VALGSERRRWVVGFGVWLSSASALAAPSMEDVRNEADRELEQELSTLSPESLPKLKEANRLRREENWEGAAAGYRALHAEVPKFSGAARRLCSVELSRGNEAWALEACREAAKHETADNLIALASTLLQGSREAAAVTEADQLAQRALALDPKDEWVQMTSCMIMLARKQPDLAARCLEPLNTRLPVEVLGPLYAQIVSQLVDQNALDRAESVLNQALLLAPREPMLQLSRCGLALSRENEAALRDCTAELRAVAPDLPQTYYFSAIQRATLGEFSEADAYLDTALAKGADPGAIADLRARIADARPWYVKWLAPFGVVIGAWLAGLALLFGVGLALSASALRAARTPPSEQSGKASGTSSFLRVAYAAVLWLCCGYYYLSIPIVIALVLALAALPIVGILALGYVAPKLFLIIGFLVLVTLFALAKSLFVRPPVRDPGVRLELERYPDLRNLLAEVAGKVGTRPVDTVFMTPDASVAVFERGGLVSQLTGKSERCLILGAGVLDDMPLDQLRAILAHEYGHFSNRDTAGGGVALAVRRSLVLTAVGLAQGGAASRLNPAWLFVNGYYLLFLRISQGASRLQEVLADRWAAFTYGSENFVDGLKHVIRRSIDFDRHAEATVKELATSKAGLANLYRHVPEREAEEQPLDAALEEALTREPTPYDSHPSPKERIELVRSLGADSRPSSGGAPAVLAWSLFPNRDELERVLTAEFCSNVYESTGLELGRAR
jgi:Zn-dependent protease with chaperone function/tetratricopeptide (TPR) repeat protein